MQHLDLSFPSGVGLDELSGDARGALRRAVSFERINVGLNNSTVPEFRRRDDALIAIVLELIQPSPMTSLAIQSAIRVASSEWLGSLLGPAVERGTIR